MFSHAEIWDAIDRLAQSHCLSASGLAVKAGFDPTAFNPSKRCGFDGRLRWPSTETIANILEATGSSMEDFFAQPPASDVVYPHSTAGIPLVGFAQAGTGGFFDDGGFPAGHGWDVVDYNDASGRREGLYALEIQGDDMLPLYRDGDILIVEPGAQIRQGDRVVVKTVDGEVMTKLLVRQSAKGITLQSLKPNYRNSRLSIDDLEWMARIIWVSQ